MKKEKSYFLSILGLFLVLSLFLIVLSTGLFINRTRVVIRDAFAERNLTGISQVSHMFDVLHAQIIPGLKEASYNNTLVTRLMYSDNLDRLEMLAGIEFLDDLLMTYPLIHSLYIYNGQMNLFLTTSSGLERADSFYDKEVLNLLKNYDRTYVDRYWPRVGITQNSQTKEEKEFQTLTLLMGTTPNNRAPLKGALISNIDVVELEKILRTDRDDPENNIFIYNQEGTRICHTGGLDQEYEDQIYNFVKKEDSTGHGSLLPDKNHLVSYQINYRLGWYMISVMPLKKLDLSILDVSRRILVIMVSLLFFSFALSYLASRRVYQPINSLVRYVSKESPVQSGQGLKNSSREFSFISSRYKDILDEKESLEESLEELQDDYRIEIFRAILDGHEYHFWEEELAQGDVELLRKPLSLFIFQIDDYYRIVQEESRLTFQNKRRSLVQFIKTALNDDREVLIDKSSRNILCLLSGLPEMHRERIQRLQRQILSVSSLSVSIGYDGRMSMEEKRLHQLFDRALSAVNGKFSLGYNQFIEYSNQDKSTVIFPGEVADKLFQCIRQGNLSGAECKLELIRKNLIQATYQDFLQHIRIFSYRILNFLRDFDHPDLQKLVQQVRSHPETLETLNNFQIFFMDILKSLISVTTRQNSKGAGHFREIENKLLQDFMNPSCCVQSLADDLKISVNYMRQIYKEYSGKSLSDEINRLRVEEASRLLKETDEAVKNLYQKAGFSNYNSFFTSFKKMKGQTPAMYRRNLEKPE